MKIAIASDFSGFLLKEEVRRFLLEKGYELADLGQKDAQEQLLYFEAAANLAKAIQRGECDRGILICGTGAGVSMIANKHKGVYCIVCESLYTAEKISLINNANVLAMGERVVSYAMGCEMAQAFLDAEWCDGFEEQRRRNNENGFRMLKQIEDNFS
jgi:ribose 5-phosphate isomerase B